MDSENISTEKSHHELTVFAEFARVSGLAIDIKSIKPRTPPEPDILCRVGGVFHYLELGRILDPQIPRHRIEVFRRHPELVAVDISKFGLPERDKLREKLRKTYKVGQHAVDLVLYYDWGPGASLTHSAPPPMGLSPAFVDAVICPEISPGRGPFNRIWIYERIRGSVLWKDP
jgi:hypothetical protein